jgi:cytochrome c oxidase assembly factor CtaG
MTAAVAGVVGPDAAWGAWSAEPVTAAAIVIGALVYLRGVECLWRRAGRGSVVAEWQVAAFVLGLVLLAVALLSPLEGLAGTLLTLHMAQHLLLTLVVAPLLALAAPALPSIWGLPSRLRPLGHRLRLPARWRAGLGAPGTAIVAAVAHVAVLWVWHLPPLYTAAIRSTPVHVLEHAMMLGSAFWLWSTLVSSGGPVRRPSPVAALALFVVATLSVGLGALLTFSPHAVFPVYEAGAAAWGTTALEDQQQAGAMMWSLSGIVYMAAGAAVFGLWLARAHRRDAGEVRTAVASGTAEVIADTSPME